MIGVQPRHCAETGGNSSFTPKGATVTAAEEAIAGVDVRTLAGHAANSFEDLDGRAFDFDSERVDEDALA